MSNRQFSLTKMLKHGLPCKVKSKIWIDEIKAMPCCHCGRPAPSDPHHILGSFGSMKTSDIMSIPLCRECHDKFQGDDEMKDYFIGRWVSIAHEKLSLIYRIMEENKSKKNKNFA